MSRTLALYSILVSAFCCGAQTPQGSLAGIVSDSSGARIAGATVTVTSSVSALQRKAPTDSLGGFRFDALPPADYRITVAALSFGNIVYQVKVEVAGSPTLHIVMRPAVVKQSLDVTNVRPSLTLHPLESASSIEKTTISARDLDTLPLSHRSFANIAYLAPMTEPVEPSDPTKARITAVSFAGSSGLNVDLSVDGGDNNDDYIGGFLQNFSPDAMEEFTVRTAQFDADTAHTNGGSVIISTRRGTNDWHGDLAAYIRARSLNARNQLDNPAPDPKQPFSRQNGVAAIGGPIRKNRLWIFSALECVRENASIAYSPASSGEFHALARLASDGLIPGIASIGVPASVAVPFRDTLFSSRLDWFENAKSQWFLRGGLDRNQTRNDLVQQATLPSTGAFTRSDYYSFLVDNQRQFGSLWLVSFTAQASGFHHTEDRNSHLGLSLAFPFSSDYHTASGFETFGDNQFVTPITAFPVRRDQQKYQVRADFVRSAGAHALKLGINLIHEPVLDGALASDAETLVQFPHDPGFYLQNPAQFQPDFAAGRTFTPASDGSFSQSIRRLGLYLQDSWRARAGLTLNYGLRYDTTFGLFRAEGRGQDQNPAFRTLQSLGIPLAPGVPHDYRKALAPRFGIAYAPGGSARTVIRAGAGLYYNDLTQNGWVGAFQAVNHPFAGLLGPAGHGALIDPRYHTPYAIQASAGFEHQFTGNWSLDVHYEHQQGVHQYRRYEYVSGVTLPADAPGISLFRADNRSRYDGVALLVARRLTRRFELSAHYTLASASTWGATVGELFDYVNGVTDVRHAFGPGDHGPSGEDVRHRLVFAGTLLLPGKVELATIAQFESARPFTLSTTVDINHDGANTNDRAVVNGRQTSLDEFRGTAFQQIDLRISREFTIRDRFAARVFAELFNLLDRSNPGNNYVTSLASLAIPPGQLANATSLCVNADCSVTRPIRSLNDLRIPAGALGDFFGPGTTVGIPFAAQLGVRLRF